MSDLIRREDAIEALRRAEALTKAFGYHNVIDTIRDLPSAEPSPENCWGCNCPKMVPTAELRWIPVTERLPEDGERVLLQIAEVCLYGDSYVEDYYYVSGSRSKGRWFINVHPDISVERGGITAWMPLPEPWKGEADG